jgi:hypothetical protein
MVGVRHISNIIGVDSLEYFNALESCKRFGINRESLLAQWKVRPASIKATWLWISSPTSIKVQCRTLTIKGNLNRVILQQNDVSQLLHHDILYSTISNDQSCSNCRLGSSLSLPGGEHPMDIIMNPPSSLQALSGQMARASARAIESEVTSLLIELPMNLDGTWLIHQSGTLCVIMYDDNIHEEVRKECQVHKDGQGG